MMIFLVLPLIQLAAAVSVDDFWEGSQVMNHSLDYYCKEKREGGGAYFSSFAIIIVFLTSKLDSTRCSNGLFLLDGYDEWFYIL